MVECGYFLYAFPLAGPMLFLNEWLYFHVESFVIFTVTFTSLHIDNMVCVQNSGYLGIAK